MTINKYKDFKMNSRRLVDNYNLVLKDFYDESKKSSMKSIYWQRYNLHKFNIENLSNFRSDNGLSSGLDDQKNPLTFELFAELINDTSEEYVLSNLSKNNIGNSEFLVKYKNYYVDYNKLIHLHWFYEIKNKILDSKNIRNICEIGGGFGSFAELFIRNYNTKLLSIDLPEAGLLTAYYLKENFPNKKFFLYDNYKEKGALTYEDFNKNDIIILPPTLNIDEKIKIDLFINSRSMQEMNKESIQFYFEFIHKFIKNDGYFLNINRYEKTSSFEGLKISDYPYDEKWKVVISKSSFKQKFNHFILSKRCIEKDNQNIKEELLKIKDLGKPYYGEYVNYVPKNIKFRQNVKKTLKKIFGKKILNFFGKIFTSIGEKLNNVN